MSHLELQRITLKVQLAEAIDIGATDGLSFIVNLKKEAGHASILREVPCQKGNEGCQGNNHEERQAGYAGNMPYMWGQDVQDRKELRKFEQMDKTSTGLTENVAGLLCYILGWVSGFVFILIEQENKLCDLD